jgi:Cys-tRNA(Pro)/Cys-tRNA(Cys) deacylase
MTPAIRLLEQASVPFTVHPYEHDPATEAFGTEAAEKLGVEPERVFKTLVCQAEGVGLLLALVPVAARLDLKALTRALLLKKRVELADPAVAERATGYVVGGISPLGGRKALPAWIDETVELFDTVFISAGRRGLEIELAPTDLVRLTGARTAALAE